MRFLTSLCRFSALSVSLFALIASAAAAGAAPRPSPPPPINGQASSEVPPEAREDYRQRSARLRSQPGRELRHLRTSRTRTFLTEHGPRTLVLRSGWERFWDGDGQAQRKDNTLVPTSSEGRAYRNKANYYVAELPSDLRRPIRFAVGDDWVEFTLLGATGHGKVSGPAERFDAAFPGVDVVFTAEADVLKEELILQGPESPTTFVYTLRLSGGLTAREESAGGIDFVDSAGRVRFSFAPPFMYDSSNRPEGLSRNVSLKLGPAAGNETTVTLAADRQWLADSRRKWPVILDPTIGRWYSYNYNEAYQSIPYGNSPWDAEAVTNWHEWHPKYIARNDLERMWYEGSEYMRMSLRPNVPLTLPPWSSTSPAPDWITFYNEVFRQAAFQWVRIFPRIDGGFQTYLLGTPPRDQPLREDLEWAIEWMVWAWGPMNAQGSGEFWRQSGCHPDQSFCANGMAYLPVRVWQFWNEPNLARNWGNDGDFGSRVGQYRDALAAARRAIRRRDPVGRVVSAGLAAGAQRDRFQRELQTGYAASGEAGHCLFDAAAMHYWDSVNQGTPQEFYSAVDTFRRVMIDYGALGSDLWITEFGAASKDTADVPARNRSQYSQNLWIENSLGLIEPEKVRLSLGPMFYFSWKDDGNRPSAYEANTGLYGLWGAVGNDAKAAVPTYARHGRDAGVRPLPGVRQCPPGP